LKVVFDQWSSTESIQRLFSEGVYTEKMGATLEMYDALKMLVYSGMIEMPLHDLLMIELRQLNLIKGKKIDHPPNGSKDLADALCRVVWCVYVDSIRDAIHGKMMLPSGQHVPTVRSIATASEILRQQYMNAPYQYMYAKSGVFPQATPGSSTVFGKGFFVRQNILPNIGKTK